LLTGTSGFLRNMKKPTTTGIRIKIIDRHRNTIPIAIAEVGSLLPKTSISAPGVWLAARVVAPKKHMNNPGHPHKTTAAMVAIIPLVFASIFFSPLTNQI